MKRKVNIDRPKISSEEISQRKNFDSVLKNSAGMSEKPLFKKPWFLSSVVVATVAIVVTAVFLSQESRDKTQDQITDNQQPITVNDSLQLAEFYKAEEAKPCISPPLAGCNVPYTTYKVNAEKGAELDFKTGSKMSIPKNAFADENGKLLKGEVELRYREFHDAVDFFVSGIPMTYDSAGTRYHFESAGMIEMLAYQDGKQVNMAPGKSVNIELASNYKGTEYNLYELDTVRNNWACLGKDKVVQAKTQPEKMSDFSESFDPAVVQQTPEYKTIETKKVEVQKEKEIKIDALPKLATRPKEPNLAKKGKYTFNLDVDAKEYPELAVYKGLLFEVGDENKNFNKSMYDITWDEAIVKEGSKKGENYSLTLKKGPKKYDLIVYPVFEGKDHEKAMKDFENKFTQYNIALDKRKAQEKQIEIEYQAKIAKLIQEQQEIERKWKEAQDNAFKTMNTQDKVRRMFAINNFGIFNCDHPSVYPKGVLCTANLQADKNRNLKCYQTYLVDKQKNGLFTYARNPITSFSFNPKSTNMLWTVEDGVLYILKPEQFSAISGSNGSSNLNMNRVDQQFKTADEMKAYLNF